MNLNATHDPRLMSWVASANDGRTPFPIQNLPHAVFRRRGSAQPLRGGVAIGDQVLDMRAASDSGVFASSVESAARAAAGSTLNPLMAMGPAAWSLLRAELSRLLRQGAPEANALRDCLVPQSEVEYAVPASIGDFTDFFSSWDHMVNAGRIFQPANPELPNFKWLPMAYHGRASSVVISGTPVRRPSGQVRPAGQATPVHRPTQSLDYELELGFYVGGGNELGNPIALANAEDHIFGACLLNDWSARDVQGWESLPLGPFLAKNFMTSVSPWIVTLEALAPYRCALQRSPLDPVAPAHLEEPRTSGFDIQMQVLLRTRASDLHAMQVSSSNFRHCYWSMAQMIAHHTEGGCNLRTGDLMGTGTQSGPGERAQGCLLELARGGREPVTLPNGETRAWMEDGDTVILRAWCEKAGAARIGFGDCVGTVIPRDACIAQLSA